MLQNDSVRKESKLGDDQPPTHFASLPRWWWIAMMAACLIGLCTKGFASEPLFPTSTIQLDAILPGPIETFSATPMGVPVHSPVHSQAGRPTMVDFSAHLVRHPVLIWG